MTPLHKGARRKIWRSLRYMERLLDCDTQDGYNAMHDTLCNMRRLAGPLPPTDWVWILVASGAELISEYEWECVRKDALREVYSD